MTRNDIIRMAEQCGIPEFENNESQAENILRFATLVADAEAKRIYEEGMVTVGHMREQILAEREACARVCDEAAESMTQMAQWGAKTCGKLIKARGQE